MYRTRHFGIWPKFLSSAEYLVSCYASLHLVQVMVCLVLVKYLALLMATIRMDLDLKIGSVTLTTSYHAYLYRVWSKAWSTSHRTSKSLKRIFESCSKETKEKQSAYLVEHKESMDDGLLQPDKFIRSDIALRCSYLSVINDCKKLRPRWKNLDQILGTMEYSWCCF